MVVSSSHTVCCPGSVCRVYSYELSPKAYGTFYEYYDRTADYYGPSTVEAIANSKCPTSDKSSKGCRPCFYLRDKQGFNVTFAKVDARIAGGGVIHAIDSVLQPTDHYPSLTAALTRNPATFSELTKFLLSREEQLAPLKMSIINTLETTPGYFAAPVNSVSAGSCLCAHSV
jgi:hypothetical protein